MPLSLTNDVESAANGDRRPVKLDYASVTCVDY